MGRGARSPSTPDERVAGAARLASGGALPRHRRGDAEAAGDRGDRRA